MGLGGLSIGHLAVILLIVILIFGTGKLKTISGDLAGAIRNFRKAMDQDDEPAPEKPKRIEPGVADAEFAEQKDKTSQS